MAKSARAGTFLSVPESAVEAFVRTPASSAPVLPEPFLPHECDMSAEILIGRSAAFCVHPVAAWARLPPGGRALLVAAYCAASYAVVLGLLFVV